MKRHGVRRASGAAPAAAALASAFPAAAQEPSWRAVSSAGDHNAFIDAASIRRDEDKVQFWYEIRSRAPETMPDGTRYDRLGSLIEIDCRARMYRHIKIYGKLGVQQLFEAPLDEAAEPIAAGSNGDLQMRAACAGEWPR